MNAISDPTKAAIQNKLKNKLKTDLGAESTIAAQRDQEKIAIEIKRFITDSDISEFHAALGQYLNYLPALEEKEPDRILHLAVPLETYDDFFVTIGNKDRLDEQSYRERFISS
ncbi:MAG: hypothetical protein HC780_19700 [Leptolyngbyaceae cyanobacterium CSU_1_3]|nr:hypothetical protein [Leptolyngbyaceae cyanobacterium CSU_1_3]